MPAVRIKTASGWQDLAMSGPGAAAIAPICARVYNSAALSIASTTVTLLTFNSERYDDSGLHSTSSNTGRFTITEAGVYEIGASIETGTSFAGQIRQIALRLNGGALIAWQNSPPVNTAAQSRLVINTTYKLAVGDYVEVTFYQDTGGNLDITATPNTSPEFWITKLQEIVGAAMPFVATLPVGPVDGQECYFQDTAMATAGVVWHLRYRSGGGTYKWEYVGGSDLFAAVGQAESTTSTTYVALTTAGPSIALPLAGDYDVELGARQLQLTSAKKCWMSYDIGATGAVDADAMEFYGGPLDGLAQSTMPHNSRLTRKTGLSAVTLTSKYRVDAGTGYHGVRWMRVRPVRVG